MYEETDCDDDDLIVEEINFLERKLWSKKLGEEETEEILTKIEAFKNKLRSMGSIYASIYK